jgi:hypothetical protein
MQTNVNKKAYPDGIFGDRLGEILLGFTTMV